MANTYVDYTATAAQTDFAFSFPYLEDEHVTVEIDGAATTDFTIVTTPATKVVLDSGATAGQIVRVQRVSAPDQNLVDFVNGSVLTESELDRAYLHNRYLAEESAEQNDVSMRLTAGATGFDALNKKIFNVVDPTSDQDAATKNYVDETVADVALGTVPDNSITSTKISDTDANFNVQSDGKIGIGTASPETQLHVVAGEDYPLDTQVGGVTVYESARFEATNQKRSISILSDKTSNSAGIIGSNYIASIDAGHHLYLATTTPLSDPADLSSFTREVVMTLTTDGKAGIGTKSPNYDLDVDGDLNITGDYKKGGNNLLLDEDDMASDSATQGATQQSIKAYVDSQQVLSKYDSGWFNDTSVLTNGGTYSFTHSLGTSAAQVQVWMATSSAGADPKQVTPDFQLAVNATDFRGAAITDINDTALTVQMAEHGWCYLDTSGVRVLGNWGTTYTHIKVIVIG